MPKLIVKGGNFLKGEISIQGAKNSVLPLLAATYLCEGQSVLHNCPELSDVSASFDILKCLGCECKREGKTVTVSEGNSLNHAIPECLMREMRSSIVFMGAVASKNGRAIMSLPGGCELGPRPIDIHIDALKRLGADIEFSSGQLLCEFKNGVKPCQIDLRFPSVGATENIILAVAVSSGTTVIRNAAKEPEIIDLALFLNKAGAKISGAGSDTLVIEGVNRLTGAEHTIMPDRIVAATYMFAVGACKGKVLFKNVLPEHLAPIIAVLKDSGCEISFVSNGLTLKCEKRGSSLESVMTQPYPGFPTDAGPIFVSYAALLKGTSVFVENIFDNRFVFIDELRRFGANVKTVGRVAVITGVKEFNGAVAGARDLRGGAALLTAALAAKGASVIDNVCYIDRGYDSIENSLNLLGADIKRV